MRNQTFEGLEDLDAQIVTWNEKFDLARFALGSLILAVAERLRNIDAAIDHVARLLSTHLSESSLKRYALTAAAFPNWQELSRQHPTLGFTTFAEAAKLPEELREKFLELTEAWSLRVLTMTSLRAKITRYANVKGVQAAQAILSSVSPEDLGGYQLLRQRLNLEGTERRVVLLRSPIDNIEVSPSGKVVIRFKPEDVEKEPLSVFAQAIDGSQPVKIDLRVEVIQPNHGGQEDDHNKLHVHPR